MNQEELLKRRKGIGASEAAAALGLSRYKSPFQLYLEKTGEIDTGGPELAVQTRGKRFEPILRAMYEEETGRKVQLVEKPMQSAEWPFMFATPDGLMPPSRGLEIKTARNRSEWGEPGSANIPQEYMIQVQHQMIVAKIATIDVYVAFSLDDVALYEIPADNELQGLIIEQEGQFWKMVESRTPPDVSDYEDVRLRYRRSMPVTRTATAEIEQAAADLRHIKATQAILSMDEAAAKAQIMKFMAEHEALADAMGNILCTWKETKPGQDFDEKTFRAAHPEIWEKFLKPPATQRRFLIKC